MDFKKILATFLVVFIAIDIFLGVQWLRLHQTPLNPSSTESVLQEMKADGIKYQRLSTTTYTGAYLSGDDGEQFLRDGAQKLQNATVTFANQTMTVTPKHHVSMGHSDESMDAAIKKMVADETKVVAGSRYRYDKQLTMYANRDTSGSKVVIYSQKISDKRLFMSQRAQIRFIVDKDYSLRSYSQSFVDNVQILRDATDLITAEKALISAYQYNEIPNNAKLNWSKLGYSPLMTVKGDTIFVPTWFFSVTSGSAETTVIRVNALNGSLMK